MAPIEVAESYNPGRGSSVESESTQFSSKVMPGDGQNGKLVLFQETLQQEKDLRAHAGAHKANYDTTERDIVTAFASTFKHLKAITSADGAIDVAQVTQSLEALYAYFDILKSLGSGSVNQLHGCIEQCREISLSYREQTVLLKEQLFETKAELQSLEQSHTKKQPVTVGSPESSEKDRKKSELTLQQGLLKGEIRELKANVNGLTKNNKDITEQIQERDGRIASLHAIQEGLEAEKNTLTRRLKESENHVKWLQGSREELQGSVEHLRSVIQHLEGELANYKQASSKATLRISELSADVEGTKKAASVAKSKAETLHQQIRNLEAEKARIQHATEGRKQMERAFQGKVAHFQDQAQRAFYAKTRLENEVQRAHNQIQELNGHAQKQSKANEFALKNKSDEISKLTQALEASDEASKSEHIQNENLQMQLFEVSEALKRSEAALTREKIQNTVTRGVHMGSVSADKVMKHVTRESGTSAIDENKSWLRQFVADECNSKSEHAATDRSQFDNQARIQELEACLQAESLGKAETKTYIDHLEQQLEKVDELKKLVETMKDLEETADALAEEDFMSHDIPKADINGATPVPKESTGATLVVVDANGTASASDEFISAPTSPCAPRSVVTSAPTSSPESAPESPVLTKANITLTKVKEGPLHPDPEESIPGEESMADFERRHLPLPMTPQGHVQSHDKREVANATFANMLGSFIRPSPNTTPRTSN